MGRVFIPRRIDGLYILARAIVDQDATLGENSVLNEALTGDFLVLGETGLDSVDNLSEGLNDLIQDYNAAVIARKAQVAVVREKAAQLRKIMRAVRDGYFLRDGHTRNVELPRLRGNVRIPTRYGELAAYGNMAETQLSQLNSSNPELVPEDTMVPGGVELNFALGQLANARVLERRRRLDMVARAAILRRSILRFRDFLLARYPGDRFQLEQYGFDVLESVSSSAPPVSSDPDPEGLQDIPGGDAQEPVFPSV